MSWNILLLCIASFVVTVLFGLEPQSTNSAGSRATSEQTSEGEDGPNRPSA
jgi:hypothetical protein